MESHSQTRSRLSPESKLKVIQAAGGIICRETASGEEVIVVYRRRHRDWTFPKGKLGEGESCQEAAPREAREETGCVVELGEYLGAFGYSVDDVPKVVLFWRMSLIEQKPLPEQEEVAEVVWLSIPEAMRKLSYSLERDFL